MISVASNGTAAALHNYADSLGPDFVSKYILACQNGDIATVKDLVDNKVVLVLDRLEDNVTGLHWAAINNRLSICSYLISMGALVDSRGGDLDATPLHWACRYGLVYIADFLLKNGADPNACDSQGFNALHLLIHSLNIMLVLYLLVLTAVDVDSPDPNARTPLQWAAYQGDALSVEGLLAHGANVNRVDNTGFTALHWGLIKASNSCLTQLIEKNLDIFQTTDDGKTAFDIAIDMDHLKPFHEALKETGRDANGIPVYVPKLFLSNPKLPKVITFLVPYVVTGLTLEFFSDYYRLWQTLVFLTGTYLIGFYFLQKLILPAYINEKKRFLKSPLLSGVFSSVAAWVIINWAVNIVPYTLDSNTFANVFFSITASIVVFTFFKAMFMNPGTVPKALDVKSQVKDLVKIGKFDLKNFCIHTFMRRPLRLKYSDFSRSLVARFDHFCPWVYNDIGLRNHKIFLVFVISLELTIGVFCYLSVAYFNAVSSFSSQFIYSTDGKYKTVKRPPHSPFQVYNPKSKNDCTILTSSLCNGYSDSLPIFVLVAFCLFQGAWVLILLFVQLFQISKNLTTSEAGQLHKSQDQYYYSPVPIELLTELESPVSNSSSIDEATQEEKQTNKKAQLPMLHTCLKLIGISQFIDTIKKKPRRPSHFNFGTNSNCMEFWCLGNTSKSRLNIRNFFRIPSRDNGETFVGDQLVDYYKLYDYPIRKVVYKEIV